MSETLNDQFGPYGSTVEDLKAYVLTQSAKHGAEGWRPVHVEYRKEMHYQTGRYRYIAYVTYQRGEESGT